MNKKQFVMKFKSALNGGELFDLKSFGWAKRRTMVGHRAGIAEGFTPDSTKG